MRPRGLALLAFGILALSGRAFSATASDSLAQNYAKWKAHRPARYAYTYGVSCFCPWNDWRVEAAGDSVIKVSVRHTSGDTVPPPRSAWPSYSVDSIFARIKTALDKKPDGAKIRYNADLGYPESAAFDPLAQATDEEYTYYIAEFADSATVALRSTRPPAPGSFEGKPDRDLAGRAVMDQGAGAVFRIPR